MPSTSSSVVRASMPLWQRVIAVIVFHALVIFAAWWSATPRFGNFAASPSDISLWLIALVSLSFAVVLVQSSTKIPIVAGAAAFLILVLGLTMLGPTIDRYQRNFSLERVDNVTVVSHQTISNGMPRATYKLPTGETVRGYFLASGNNGKLKVTKSQKRRISPPFQLARWPFASPVDGSSITALVNRDGSGWARNALDNEGSSEGKSSARMWALGTALAFLPAELICVSALIRRHPRFVSDDSDASDDDEHPTA